MPEQNSRTRPGHAALDEELARLLIESIDDYAIFMLDPSGHVASWNSGAERIKGYSPGEILGRHFSLFYPPGEIVAGKCEHALRCATEQGRFAEEGWRIRKNGERFWASVTLTAMRDATGRLRGFAKVTKELTERRQAEEQLRRSEEQFRLLVSGVKDYAIFMMDTEGRVLTWNEGAANITGYTAKEIVGEPVALLYPPGDVAREKPSQDIETAKREGRLEEEGWRLRKDGTTYQARVTLSPVYDATGALLGFAKVTRDLTESKRAEDERVRLAQAQEAIRMRDEFLSIASHELKTPLTALQLQSLRERLDSVEPRAHAKLERAVHSTERLSDLIEKLLDVSRLSSGQLTLNLERFDLLAAVNDVTESLREAASNASCVVHIQGAQSIEGNWDRLRRFRGRGPMRASSSPTRGPASRRRPFPGCSAGSSAPRRYATTADWAWGCT
ncbi:PAS domain S-box protein [Archangium violaceum]|uniref:PAS domain-containing sensor histidine kinase n=1 Tax=Archangium violaceum TaxID=83451 RepID=UPI00193B03F3|nr:PAS domain-containing sensor histidine kinase [Archangium violaceum]QRK12364.1 PAS domain S-box protein [Archangium violaceum]